MNSRTLVGLALFVLAGCGGEVAPEIAAPPETKPEVLVAEPGQPQPQPQPSGCNDCLETFAPQPGPQPTAPPPIKQAPVEPVKCAPGEKIELTFVISASDMSSGASDNGGEGLCTATVTFNADGAITPGKGGGGYNGYSTCSGGEPNRPHCGTLTYPSGKVEKKYCDVFAICENGLAHAVGFSW